MRTLRLYRVFRSLGLPRRLAWLSARGVIVWRESFTGPLDET